MSTRTIWVSRCTISFFAVALILSPRTELTAQPATAAFGEVVPRNVREMYDRGLQYLANTQSENGDWPGGGGELGPGTTGLGLLVFLACGEDPNFGPYSNHVRPPLRNVITAQDASTGMMGHSMYHHGFATLALAEAYGVVDERNLWPDKKGPRSIGKAVELAVRAAITSKRRTPSAPGDTRPTRPTPIPQSAVPYWWVCSRRNAGIEVPDETIDKAITYYAKMTSASGEVASFGRNRRGSVNHWPGARSQPSLFRRRRKDLKESKATLDYLKQRLDQTQQVSAGVSRLPTRPRPCFRAISPPGRNGTNS